ncbi:Cloroperoxidase [Laetiporus sulphureus 93-53]|uniref:Cloroperoxidase n=1 Tax=Laetiporus sulphureus 93-53 TaxID=1314785 RepID=A0A165I4B6_9APHY|nr:Cloroperoxidase [Laetiporus sulphureus 93-53]KZT12576.1 Cloroperoxidase [Laetiporus sulphureus 93-53]
MHIDHDYVCPPPGASRSPCPALNALANHNYLPHDGRRISIPQLVRALTSVYSLSFPLAIILAVVGVFKCGGWWHIDLHDLAKHNAIEHDGSLTHDDTPRGSTFAPIEVDSKLVHQLLSVSPCEWLTLSDFAKARAERDQQMQTPLDALHAEIARGEAVLTMEVLGQHISHKHAADVVHHMVTDEQGVPKTFIEQWFQEEKLPDGWRRPATSVGLFEVAMKSRWVEKEVRTLRTKNA